MKRITPLNGHVTVQPDKPAEATKSGILLVEQLGDYAPIGTVIDSASDLVKPGDRVVFAPYEYVDFDKDLAIMHISCIYGILTGEAA